MMEVPYHYQFRIIVIGDTMVGKSSLLKTFSEGTFGEMEPTVGVDFFSKIIEIKPSVDDNQISSPNNKPDESIIVKLQIWDTAGQERFRSIVTSYYRNSVGIVLVYDVTNRESYDHLIDWFNEARRHCEPSLSPTLSPVTQQNNYAPKLISNNNNSQYPLTSTPNATPTKKTTIANRRNHKLVNISNINSNRNTNVNNNLNNASFNSLSDYQSEQGGDNYKMAYLVLGCKTDLEEQRQVSYEDGQAFADMYGFKFIETSSKVHYNVNQAFQLLAEEIYEKISECGRLNRLHRTPSGTHLTFHQSSPINEGIRIGPLIENNSRRYYQSDRVQLLEAQPVSGFLGGCC